MRSSLSWQGPALAITLAGWLPAARAQTEPDLRQQVMATERAFATTMAERQPDSFARFVADEAIFFNETDVSRGKTAVLARWARFFAGPKAPFSWSPDRVEVLASGTLALSTGLVRDAQGQPVARFNSIWRQEAPGVWRIVFDKGSPLEAGEVR